MGTDLLETPATLSLLVITVAVSLLAFANKGVWRFLALEPYAMIGSHQYHPLLSSGLIHADFMHLAFNMLTLFFFGPILEQTVGSGQFFAIYFVSLIVGSLYPFIKYRNDPNYIAIGASGAVSGVVFSFCMFYPDATIRVFMALPMPAFVYAILYTAYSIYGMRRRTGNIGHEAHLAGALGGVITTIIVAPEVIDIMRGYLPF